MNWGFLDLNKSTSFSPFKDSNFISTPPPPSPPPPPPPTSAASQQAYIFDLSTKLSPNVLLTIIVFAIIFFVAGLIHLLVRFIIRPPFLEGDDIENDVTVLQGQLQQLFHLHDAGVDQSFIDTLPVFHYKDIIGLKNPFDCAVCLCEFEHDDKLRLLPKCSHAFHMECIDTWLLSHSTCPLCRSILRPDSTQTHTGSSPVVLVLESGRSEASRESFRVMNSNPHLGFHGEVEFDPQNIDSSQKDETLCNSSGRIVHVKLGKYRNVDGVGNHESCSNGNGIGIGIGIGIESSNVDARRCFSMGSFEYVMDENSFLQVPIRTPMRRTQTKNKNKNKKGHLPLTPGHRLAMSECEFDSSLELNRFETMKPNGNPSSSNGKNTTRDDDDQCDDNVNGNVIGRTRKKESFSISKIWLRGKDKHGSSSNTTTTTSRRAFSFRFSGSCSSNNVVVGGAGTRTECEEEEEEEEERRRKAKNVVVVDDMSELGSERWGYGSEMGGGDEENQRRCSVFDGQVKTPSFTRRTLLWLSGKQNKVVNCSSLNSNDN